MRKLMLSLVFVLGAMTMVNANTNETVTPPKYTFDECDSFATIIGDMFDMSYEEEHEFFSACMEM